MQIFVNSPNTQRGSKEWFDGTVFVDAVINPDDISALRAARVTFAPGARTAWHTHPNGQAIHVLVGVCQAQAKGGPVQELTPGQSAWFAPGEVHWHGAHPHHAMVHLAVQQPDADGKVVTWLDHVNATEIQE